jgi:hypothetical protein
MRTGFPAFQIFTNWDYSNITNGSMTGMTGTDPDYGKNIRAIAIGDINNDGKNETVVSYWNETNAIRMYNSSGFETNITNLPIGVHAENMAIGDINRDGQKELIIGLSNDAGRTITQNTLRNYQNTSGGWVETNMTSVNESVTAMAFGDVNNNGIWDVTIGFDNYTRNNTRFYENKSGGWVETNISDNYGYTVNTLAVGWTKTDKKNKTVIGLFNAPVAIRKYENTTGKWVEKNVSTDINNTIPVTAYDIKIADINNDGKNEVVMGYTADYGGVYGKYYSIKYYSNPAVELWTAATMIGINSQPTHLDVGDIDNDGKNETVYGTSTFSMNYLYNSSSTFWEHKQIATETVMVQPNGMKIGDYNNDGKKEIVYGGSILGVPPYNQYVVREFHYTATVGGGGAAGDMFCVKLSGNKRFCNNGNNDYLCIKDNCVVIS